jgi:hypothetical protein
MISPPAIIRQVEEAPVFDFTFESDAAQWLYRAGESIRDRVTALYGKQTWMAGIAYPMCQYRAWVIDYFEQFPALPLWIAPGIIQPSQFGPKEKEVVARTVIDLFSDRPKLKAIMRRWHITQPMRRLQGRSILPRHYALLKRLSEMNPSAVAQVIPEGQKPQRRWLNTLAIMLTRRFPSPEAFEWLVLHVGSHPASGAGDMRDFMMRGDAFDFRWTWGQADAAQQRWHVRLRAEDVRRQYGHEPDAVLCNNPMPDLVEIRDYQFHALRTPAVLHEEGRVMRHCVASYVPKVADGACWIVSMRQGEKRLATLEFSPAGFCWQMRGFANSTNFSPDAKSAVRQYERNLKLIA